MTEKVDNLEKVDKADKADKADKVEKIDKDKIDYNTDLEYLLKIHAEECESFSILHRYSYEKYNERSNYINIPVIILSSAIGFATGIDIGYDNMNIILGVSSIFVGIIKSIDTYFQLGKRSESHRLCSLQFQQINKKIMIELSLKRDQRISAKDMLQIIKTDIKNLQDIAPLIDEEIVKIFKKNYGELDASSGKITFNAHTPNLCNGLTEVVVNGDKIVNVEDTIIDGTGKRRRRSSRERRRSRGSSPDSYGSRGDDDDDEGDDDNDGRGGGGIRGVGVTNHIHGSRGSRSGQNSRQGDGNEGHRRNHRNNHNNHNNHNNNNNHNNHNHSPHAPPRDGNMSSASNSSGFMSSVSNFIKGGVNLITGNRSRPPSSNSASKIETQDEYRERRRRNNKENSSDVTSGVAGVLGAANAVNNIATNSTLLENIIKQQNTNEIVELTDAVSYSGQQVGNSQSKHNTSALSTPVSRYTPMIQMNNSIQPNTFVQRPEPLNSEQLQQLQQLQNLQQFFNSQQQILLANPTTTLVPLPIPQLVAQASTPRISTPMIMPNVLPSNASNRSNTPSILNLQIQGTENILNAVSANLVYAGAGVNANGSQNITPITSKPASVIGDIEREALALPHSYFVSNISVSGINNTTNTNNNTNNNEEEVIINNVNIDDNIIINILPLTSDNLTIHEGVMLQDQQTSPIEDDPEGMM
jgi:hypothetical protein